MLRYWIIAPIETEPRAQFDRVWQFDLDNEAISIGWAKLGDVSAMKRQELAEAVKVAYPEKPSTAVGLCANMIWNFYNQIKPDDMVVARRGRKVIAGIGRVSKMAFYAPGKNPFCNHPHFLGVQWQLQPRDRAFPTVAFPMQTVAEISKEQFQKLFESDSFATADADSERQMESVELVDSASLTFVLEKYLEEFIVSNFQSIFQGTLTLYRDSEGNDGQQYATDIGQIDILAFEPKSQSFVVIELKKGRSSDQVVGQILRYMGWVKENLCTVGQNVKGLVVCREPDPRLTYALQMTSGIDLRYYDISFKLMDTSSTRAA